MLLGLLGAIGTPIFVTIMDWGTALLWPEPPGVLPFSGSWRIVVILTVAGLLVGLIHRLTYSEEVVFVGAIVKGRLDPRRVRGTLLEANMSQTVGSASSSVASGVIFTLPALFLWGMVPPYLQVVALAFLGGVLVTIVGLAMTFRPGLGLATLTLMMAAAFLIEGVLNIVMAFRMKPEKGWGWMLFNGLVVAALGVFLMAEWPVSGTW